MGRKWERVVTEWGIVGCVKSVVPKANSFY